MTRGTQAPEAISVIVPVHGGESPPAAELLARLGIAGVEVIIASGGNTSADVLGAFERAGTRVLSRDAPRGERLRQAAGMASGEILLFLHADTVPPEGWAGLVATAISAGAVAGAFRLAFAGDDPRMAWVAAWANLRTRLTRVPYGDQAPFVRRSVYERLGGHRPWPLMEDVELGHRLRRAGHIALLPAAVLTSPRRYLERGVARTVLKNWTTLLRYRLGTSPEKLAEDYRK